MPSLKLTFPNLEQEVFFEMDWQPAAASASEVVAKKLRRVIISECSLYKNDAKIITYFVSKINKSNVLALPPLIGEEDTAEAAKHMI
jgi:hypothetical protein